MKKPIMFITVLAAAFTLNAAEALFKQAKPIWIADKSAIADAKTVKFWKWVGIDERKTVIRVASDGTYKVRFEGKLSGYGDEKGKVGEFQLVSGKGAHMVELEVDANANYIIAEMLDADGKVIGQTSAKGQGYFHTAVQVPAKVDGKEVKEEAELAVLKDMKLEMSERPAPAFGMTAFKPTGKKHWLYRLFGGKSFTFVSSGVQRGFPTANFYCVKPGTVTLKWGAKSDEQAEIVFTKEGGKGFSTMKPFATDKLVFSADQGEFEITGMGVQTLVDGDLAQSSLACSDPKLNGEYAKAKRMSDRKAINKIYRKALGLKSIDEAKKTITIDPTVRNGLTFCGAKIAVADGILDIRWMREEGEGMATTSQTLPAGWTLVRDFDMQDECQRLVDSAIADGLQGGVQFCAYKNGKCIVDVYAGKLSQDKDAPAVKSDSLFPIFSTEKTLLSTAVHRAVEQGKMDYDKPLCTWWPELTGEGKEKLTLRETLGYRTGLPGGCPGKLTDKDLCNWDLVVKTAAADKPHCTPGTVQAYLPYAYAWMIGHPLEVAMGKPLKQVLDEEVLIPAGIDKEFYFVIPREEYPRVANFYYGSFCEIMNTDWARQALLPSAWAASSAKALCKFYNRLCGFDGKAPLIKKETLDAALKPCRHESDPLPCPESMRRDWFMLFGMGYGLWGSADRMDRVFGHGGAGGSEGLVDRDQELIVGYTCNYSKNSIELRDKLYEVVGMRWRYWNDNVNIQDLQMTTSSSQNLGGGITSH